MWGRSSQWPLNARNCRTMQPSKENPSFHVCCKGSAGHRDNLDGATEETQPRSRGRESSGKKKGKSLAASWEAVNYGISLPHPVEEPQFVEIMLLCLGIPK